MKNSSSFFANKECRYYPCHEGQEPFNCLFCYCPFYLEEKCPGNPTWLKIRGKIIKDCTACTFPHRPESYDVIINWIKKANETRTYSEEIQAKAIEIKPE
ncbi:MAG: metal-binding protein [Eubacterium sp.]|nr:metal-binding protein [Eubacterium sp.]